MRGYTTAYAHNMCIATYGVRRGAYYRSRGAFPPTGRYGTEAFKVGQCKTAALQSMVRSGIGLCGGTIYMMKSSCRTVCAAARNMP